MTIEDRIRDAAIKLTQAVRDGRIYQRERRELERLLREGKRQKQEQEEGSNDNDSAI